MINLYKLSKKDKIIKTIILRITIKTSILRKKKEVNIIMKKNNIINPINKENIRKKNIRNRNIIIKKLKIKIIRHNSQNKLKSIQSLKQNINMFKL